MYVQEPPRNDPSLPLDANVAWGGVLALGVNGASISDNTCDAGVCGHDANGNPPPLVTAGVDPRFTYARSLVMQDNTGWQGTSQCIGPLNGCSSGPTTGAENAFKAIFYNEPNLCQDRLRTNIG